jgi:glutathione S-transferase
MIRLYHGEPNLFSLKALIALEEKGAPYDRTPIGQVPLERVISGYPAETAHQINFEREGPVLVDGAETIVNSFFLLEYIDETVPGPALLPSDPLARYHARSIGQLVTGMIAPFVTGLGLAAHPLPVAAGSYDDIEPVERREAWQAASGTPAADVSGFPDRLRPTLAKLEAMLAKSGDWFLDDFSIADIDVFAMVRNLPELAPGLIDADATPALAAFVARMEARPATQRALGFATGDASDHAYTPGPEISRWG